METSNENDILPSLGIIGRLDESIRSRLGQAGEFTTAPVGFYVAKQGQPHNALAVILEGKLSVSTHAHGDIVKLANLGPGETVGEMSIIDPQKASADVVVVDSPAKLWTISGDALEKLVQHDPVTGYKILKVLATELCRRLRHNSEVMLRREETRRDRFFDMDY